MLVSFPNRFCKPDSIDDGRVVQSIADDGVLGSEDSLEEAGIGVEAAGKEDAIFMLVIVCNYFLQLLVNVLSSADEPNRAHAETMRVQGPFGCFDESGII